MLKFFFKLATQLNLEASFSLTTKQTKSRLALTNHVLSLSLKIRKNRKIKFVLLLIIQTFVKFRLYHSSGLHP